MQSSSAVTAIGLLVGSSDTSEHNPSNWKKDDITVTSWGTRTRYEYDPNLGVLITIVESVVAHGTPMPTPTATAGHTYDDHAAWGVQPGAVHHRTIHLSGDSRKLGRQSGECAGAS